MAEVVTLEFESQEAAPEALRPLLVKDEKSGKFVGEFAKPEAVKEFRTNNIAFREERDRATAAATAAKAAADKAAAELQALKDQAAANATGVPNEKLEEEVKRRIERKEADLNARIKAADEAAESSKVERERIAGLLRKRVIEGDLTATLSSMPDFVGTTGAVADARRRVMEEWDEEDGAAVMYQKPHDPKSGVRLGSDGKTPLQMKEWLASLRTECGHWFKANVNGGGAAGGRGAGGAHVITRSEAADVHRYRAAKAAAEKAGVTLQILG